MDDKEIKRVFGMSNFQMDPPALPSFMNEDDEDNEGEPIEYRTTSRYQTQTTSDIPGGKSTVRVTSYETTRARSTHGDSDIFKSKHVSVTTPDNMLGEGLFNENNRMQAMRKLKSSFLSKDHMSMEQKPDPFARFGTRSMVEGMGGERSVIEIHKFPFAEPFSSPDSIKKEKVTYSTQVKSVKANGQTTSNVTQTKILEDGSREEITISEIEYDAEKDETLAKQ